uniref:Venom polypeptide n=1 Tax=Dolopus genitalis TaxID=2488630 RepID=A0A3G5BIG5_DOLGE|nr:venom polypeptide [Dolopus genitalis]
MKSFILVLLGLCAIASALEPVEFGVDVEFEPKNELPDIIRNKIEEFLKKVIEDFDTITTKIENMVVRLNGQIAELVAMAKDKLHAVKTEVQGKLAEVKKQGGEAAVCATKLEPEYHKVEEDFLDEIKTCAAEARRATHQIREDVLKGIANVKNHVKDFREMLKDCLKWNPIRFVKCMKEKHDEFKAVIDDIFNSAQGALRIAQMKAVQISGEAHVCNVYAVKSAEAKIEKLNEKLSSCGKFEMFVF